MKHYDIKAADEERTAETTRRQNDHPVRILLSRQRYCVTVRADRSSARSGVGARAI